MRGTAPRLRPRLTKWNEYTNICTKNKINYEWHGHVRTIFPYIRAKRDIINNFWKKLQKFICRLRFFVSISFGSMYEHWLIRWSEILLLYYLIIWKGCWLFIKKLEKLVRTKKTPLVCASCPPRSFSPRIQPIKVRLSFSCKCTGQKCPPITLLLLSDQMEVSLVDPGRSQLL